MCRSRCRALSDRSLRLSLLDSFPSLRCRLGGLEWPRDIICGRAVARHLRGSFWGCESACQGRAWGSWCGPPCDAVRIRHIKPPRPIFLMHSMRLLPSFLVLGLAIDETARLEGVLGWSETLPVEMAVMGLVFLLAVHLFGGLRLLVLEFLDWHDRQKSVAAAAVALSFAAAAAFFLQVI